MLNFFKKILSHNYLLAAVNIVIAVFIAGSLISYDSADPSLNVATLTQVKNLLGVPGAYFADLAIQLIGYSAWLFALYFLSWGVLYINREYISFYKTRIFISFLSILLFAHILDFVTHDLEFLSLKYNGGVVGSKISSKLYFLREYKPYDFIAKIIFFISLCLIACGFQKEEYLLATRNLLELCKNLLKRVIAVISNLRSRNSEAAPINFNSEPESNYSERKKVVAAKTSAPKIKTPLLAVNQQFKLPDLSLFNNKKSASGKYDSKAQLTEKANRLTEVLAEFGVKGQIIGVNQGPVVTLFEFEPAAGTKSSRVIGLSDDIARSLSAVSARIAVIPGRNALGIELPNKEREFFFLKELIDTKEYKQDYQLPLVLGKDIAGRPTIADLAKMPHLLVAGTTGSGKSVAINTMIVSLLYRYNPDECKFIMIDPKMLELSVYDGIPHLLTPVVTEPAKAVVALKWAVKEMENRYKLMSNLGVRNINNYNERIVEAISKKQNLERTIQTGFDPDTGKPQYETIPIELKKLPYIVVIVDEMADLMLVAGKDIESSIQRLAQMARAAGIHIIMATQRPSVDVITGVIKANFPSRISFKVTSKIDSRTILGEQGAEQLLGMGDMLFMGGAAKINRVHGPFVDDNEVGNIVNYLKSQATPTYITSVTESDDEESNINAVDGAEPGSDDDLYNKALAIVKKDRKVSTSYIQRCLRIGYNRAAIIVERMEEEGVISAPNHVGRREILLPEN